MAKHTAYDLKQMQSLPFEAKIIMTKQRIKAWYESWIRYEIVNKNTGKTRYVTATEEPPLKEGEYINSEMDGMVYVSFSGGKDSTVLKHIVDSMYDDVPSLFVNTGLEYPEIQKFAMSQKNVITVRPEMRFDEVIKKYGYPIGSKETADRIEFGRKALERGDLTQYRWYIEGERTNPITGEKYTFMPLAKRFEPLFDAYEIPISQRCCTIMKKKPLKQFAKESGRMPIIGSMANESILRYSKWLKEGCNAFEGNNPTSKPLSFWTEQDILQYIKEYNIPYCSVYGDIIEVDGKLKTTGCDRTGCIFCMFGCHLEKSPNRFQRLKETHPRQYEYCIGGGEMVDGKWQPSKEGLGLGKVLDYIGVDYE